MLNTRGATQFIRFCLVGAANTAVDFSVFALLNIAGTSYVLAQVLAYASGAANSYILNKHWTFRVSGAAQWQEMVRFAVLNASSLLLSSGLLFMLHSVAGLGLWASKVLITGMCVAFTFVGSRLWVFALNDSRAGDAI